MTLLIAYTLAAVFAVLSLVHVYWSLGGKAGCDAAVPKVPGKTGEMRPAFVPTPAGTFKVAVVLWVIATLVCLRAGLGLPAITHGALQWFLSAVALGMFLRAIGDFKAVGFFKRIRGSTFARRDTWAYSPLCVLLGLGLLAVAWG
ncbi:DUF3995 domain-containing protein [Pseudomonas sp. Irchel 3E20]|uniref:DUF3995 domain-containing protein n=1 Tax=Pseudomonas sp. Irchel 3E20 TaxID=2008983 RepID=UPI000BA49EF5|nr:DUF3995 domain-containing protein [Pseudomonas sp. Irchel 3E20]